MSTINVAGISILIFTTKFMYTLKGFADAPQTPTQMKF